MQADLVLYNIGQLVTSRELDKTKSACIIPPFIVY